MVDFKRIQWAINHDFNTNTGDEPRSKATLPTAWTNAAMDILNLPIAAWNDPGCVSGEISNAKVRSTNMADALDEIFDGMGNTTLDPNTRSHGPRPGAGKSILVLKKYYAKKTFKKGWAVFADLIVANSDDPANKAGDVVSVAWFIEKQGLAGDYEKARGTGFLCSLLGIAETPAGKLEASKKGNVLRGETQPGRGIMVQCDGVKNGDFMNYTWTHIPQSGEQIAATRAKIDGATEPVAAAAPPPPPPVAAPTASTLIASLFK